MMNTPSLIRVTDNVNDQGIWEGLVHLKGAKHASLGDTLSAPLVVSCKSAVEYLLKLSVEIDLVHLSDIPIEQLPQEILRTVEGSKIIDHTEARMGDLVFYFGKLLRDQSVISINHVGIMIDNNGYFYHSARTTGLYSLSYLERKVQEGKVATRQQLSPNLTPILTRDNEQHTIKTIQNSLQSNQVIIRQKLGN